MSITLYQHPLSGHSHRVRAFLSILDLKVNVIDVDLMAGAHKEPDFLAMNQFGQVPVIKDDDIILSDSNAILIYLAQRYDTSNCWYPTNSSAQAIVHKFLSVAAGPLAFGPAAARLVNVFAASLDHERAIEIANNLLSVLDAHLVNTPWLAGPAPTIADIANYAYIAHAPEGDVDLSVYPNVTAWLNRVEGITGFEPMQATAVGLAA